MISFQKLIKAGCHFGHQKSRGCPKMAPYIWGHRNGIHLIDISKTAQLLENASRFLKNIAAEGKTILWVGTKKPAQDIIFSIAQDLNMPYVNNRWVGGTLSNFVQVKKSVTKYLHDKDVLEKVEKQPELYHHTKKEITVLHKRIERLRKNIGGICGLTWPVGAVVIVDVKKEHSAVNEASRMKIPIVALVDTNCDPSPVDYVIPGNDDVPRSIAIIMQGLQEAVKEGMQEYNKKQQEEKEQIEKEKAEKKKAVAIKTEEVKEASEQDVAKTERTEAKKGVKKVVTHKKVEKETAE